MGTRSNLIVADSQSRIQLYRHWDGYPDGDIGVLATLEKALPYAWPLPRFEADDFAAAIVRAWKEEGGGNIYIDGTPEGWELIHGDVEWVYTIQPVPQDGNSGNVDSAVGPVVSVYDWSPYLMNKLDPDAKKPKLVSQVPLSQANTAGLELGRLQSVYPD